MQDPIQMWPVGSLLPSICRGPRDLLKGHPKVFSKRLTNGAS